MKTSLQAVSRIAVFVLLVAASLGSIHAQQNAAIAYSSYLLTASDRINAVQVSHDGSVYVAGVTLASSTAIKPASVSAGEGKAFVAKFSPDGARVVYFTYLSNSKVDEARALAIDSAGNAYVAGATRSTSFAVVNPLQAECKLDGAGQCSGTAFVAKLNAAGVVVFATYLGGSGGDEANAIAVDSRGNMFVAGGTKSLDFPVEKAMQATASGKGDAFVSALAADGSRLLFSSYLGGSGSDEARGLALDAEGNLYITGKTASLDFPTGSPLQSRCGSNGSTECSGTAFVTMLSAAGNAIQYSTYLGGSGGDSGNSITVDQQGNVFVAGVTSSTDFPTMKATQSALKGKSNAFVSEISSGGASLLFSTYLGGSRADQASAIVLDQSGNAVVSGSTSSHDFPVSNALQASCNSNRKGECSVDAFVALISPTSSQLQFSTYLGGTGVDVSRALAIDSHGSVYLSGWTTSRDFAQAKWPAVPANVANVASPSRTPGGAFLSKISGLGNGQGKAKPGSCSKNWTGTAGDNQWSNANNWNPSGVPGSGDNVCIASTFTSTITIGTLGSANQTITSLNSGAPISFTGGPLTVSGSATFSSSLSISAGTLTFNGATSIATFTLSGNSAMSGTGAVSVTGTMNWTGGTVNGTGGLTIPSAATLTMTCTTYYCIDYATLNNQGKVAETAGNAFYVRPPATINNSGSWTLNSDVNVIADQGAVVFNNTGSFVKSGGTATTSWAAPINGSGSINVASGTLDLDGTSVGTITGPIAVQSGATLEYGQGGTLAGAQVTGSGTFIFTSTTTVSGKYSFSGTTEITAGTTSFNGATTIATFTLSGNSGMSGTGAVSVTGTMNWTGGTVNGTGGLTIPSAATLTMTCTTYYCIDYATLNNQGKVAETAGNAFYVRPPAVINNSGSWTLNSDVNVIADQGAVVFNNTGSFVKSGGTATTSWAAPINGSGSINVASGTLNLDGASVGTITGPIAVQSGATLEYGQGGTLAGAQVTGSGTFIFTSTTTVSGKYSFSGTTEITAGTTSFNGATTIATFTLSGNSGMSGTGAVSVTGTMNWTGGTVNGTGGLTIPSAATLTMTCTSYYCILYATLNNQGKVAETAGNAFYVRPPAVINNSGSWTLNSDVNVIADQGAVVFNNTGSFVKSGGTATTSWAAPINGSGSINVASGTLNLDGASVGTITGPIAVQSGATLEYGQGGTLAGAQVTGSGTFIFTSTTTVSGKYSFSGTTEITAGTTSFNGATTIATFTLSGNSGMSGTGAVSVTGTMNWTGGTVNGTGGLTIPSAATLTMTCTSTTASTTRP